MDLLAPGHGHAGNERGTRKLPVPRGRAHDLSLFLARVLRLVPRVGEARDQRDARRFGPFTRLGEPRPRFRGGTPSTASVYAVYYGRTLAPVAAGRRQAFNLTHPIRAGVGPRCGSG